MSLQKLKQNMVALELEEDEDSLPIAQDKVEVLCDSLEQALKIASNELNTPLENLDYEIIQKGFSGFMGFGKMPHRVLVSAVHGARIGEYDIKDMDVNLNAVSNNKQEELELNSDGKALVRIYKTGVVLTIRPPSGTGLPVDIHTTLDKIRRAGVHEFNKPLVERAVKQKAGKEVKIADWIPNPDADSTLTVEISPDEMVAYLRIFVPKPGGRHLQEKDIVNSLKHFGVVHGYQKDILQEALDMERYEQQIPVAKGTEPRDGKNGYIDYKVRINIDKKVKFKENEQGRVDFLAKNMVENVVEGQLLAMLVPGETGHFGKTVTGKVIPAKDGKHIELRAGKGTALSSDKTRLMAQKNGQVVCGVGGKLTVEDIHTVRGDVGLDTGNITFLGSVIVTGSITDNMQVKAAGNIEVGGSVQKAHVEAEGDVVIQGGIQGRDNAYIKSKAGSLFAKFIQNANITVEKDVFGGEAIMHSKVQAVGKVTCSGKRGQVVGGEILTGEDIRVKQLGAQASTPTLVVVGVNPKIVEQQRYLQKHENESMVKMQKTEQNIHTLRAQKESAGAAFSPEKEEMLTQMVNVQKKLIEKIQEITEEKQRIKKYVTKLSNNPAVHVEKMLFPGVTVEINGARFISKDEYSRVTLIEEKGNIKILPYQEDKVKNWKKRSLY